MKARSSRLFSFKVEQMLGFLFLFLSVLPIPLLADDDQTYCPHCHSLLIWDGEDLRCNNTYNCQGYSYRPLPPVKPIYSEVEAWSDSISGGSFIYHSHSHHDVLDVPLESTNSVQDDMLLLFQEMMEEEDEPPGIPLPQLQIPLPLQSRVSEETTGSESRCPSRTLSHTDSMDDADSSFNNLLRMKVKLQRHDRTGSCESSGSGPPPLVITGGEIQWLVSLYGHLKMLPFPSVGIGFQHEDALSVQGFVQVKDRNILLEPDSNNFFIVMHMTSQTLMGLVVNHDHVMVVIQEDELPLTLINIEGESAVNSTVQVLSVYLNQRQNQIRLFRYQRASRE